jgi:hypothetical protein
MKTEGRDTTYEETRVGKRTRLSKKASLVCIYAKKSDKVSVRSLVELTTSPTPRDY